VCMRVRGEVGGGGGGKRMVVEVKTEYYVVIFDGCWVCGFAVKCVFE
jgi:hypothetical protein